MSGSKPRAQVSAPAFYQEPENAPGVMSVNDEVTQTANGQRVSKTWLYTPEGAEGDHSPVDALLECMTWATATALVSNLIATGAKLAVSLAVPLPMIYLASAILGVIVWVWYCFVFWDLSPSTFHHREKFAKGASIILGFILGVL